MQMNLLRKVSLLEFRAASSSDAVKPTPYARIGFGRAGAAAALPCWDRRCPLLGSAFSPVRGFPFMGVEGKQTNENENEGHGDSV